MSKKIRKITRIKRQFDLGGIYMGYYSMIATTAILIAVLKIQGIHWYLIGAVVLFLLRWFVGYLHEKYLFKEEQKQTMELNTVMMEMDKKLNAILAILEKDETKNV